MEKAATAGSTSRWRHIGYRLACVIPALLLAACRDGAAGPAGPSGPSSPEGITATVTVDLTRDLGPLVTGGGTNFTGLAPLNPAAGATLVPDLRAIPSHLNRVHFAGETIDREGDIDKDPRRFPQPGAPPAAWDFRSLDAVVDLARQTRAGGGADFIMSIHNAPLWMSGGRPGKAPANFELYAQYCARLVAYYNRGGFTDDAGREVRNPVDPAIGGRITWWEIWNEPDGNDFGDSDEAVLTPEQYAALFQVVSASMRAVDPDIRIGGPNTAWNHAPYLKALTASGARVDFVALHQYDGEPERTDAELFQQARSPSTLAASQEVGTGSRLLIISEFNALVASSDSAGAGQRLAGPFSLAYLPLFYVTHAQAGTLRVIRWETVERFFGLFDQQTGARLPVYYAERLFWSALPEGGRRVACSSTVAAIACLATVGPDGVPYVVIVNAAVQGKADINGRGVPHRVQITGLPAGTYAAQVVDGTTGTTPRTSQSAAGRAPEVLIQGYGSAVIARK